MTARSFATRIAGRFWAWIEAPEGGLYDQVGRSYQSARSLTRAYYAGLALVAFVHLSSWDYYAGLREIQPLWPVFWTSARSGRDAVALLLFFLLASLAAALFPHRLLARAAAFAGCFEFFAFVYSFGAVRHVHHHLLLSTFLFVFLPRGSGGTDATEEEKRAHLRAFWGVQCGVLLTYSMCGFVRIATGLWHLVTGQGGVLTPPALALHAANAGIRFGVDPLLADLAIRAGWMGLPVYLVVTYLELFALPVAFRPRLHRPWGAALILMHVGIGLTLNLFFVPSIFILGVLLLASPFAPDSVGWRLAARDLPLVGRWLPGTRPTS